MLAPCVHRCVHRRGPLISVGERVLAAPDDPMRVRDIHRSCESTLGRSISYGSLKTCLSAGDGRELYRVGWGLYAAKGGEPAGCP
jgi:hypothetical protein